MADFALSSPESAWSWRCVSGKVKLTFSWGEIQCSSAQCSKRVISLCFAAAVQALGLM